MCVVKKLKKSQDVEMDLWWCVLTRTRRESLGFSPSFFIKSFHLVLWRLNSAWTKTPPSTKVCGLLPRWWCFTDVLPAVCGVPTQHSVIVLGNSGLRVSLWWSAPVNTCKASLKALFCTETSQTFQVCSIEAFLKAVAQLLRQREAFFFPINLYAFVEKPNHFTDFLQMNANTFSVVCNGLYLTHSSPDSLLFLNHLVWMCHCFQWFDFRTKTKSI